MVPLPLGKSFATNSENVEDALQTKTVQTLANRQAKEQVEKARLPLYITKFFALYFFNIHEVVQDKSTKSCLKSFLDFINNCFNVQYFIKVFGFVFVQVLFRDKYSELY